MAGSALLLDEFFTSGDERFVDELLACEAAGSLKALGPRWLADTRPFARRALLAYLTRFSTDHVHTDRVGHRPLLKALFKGFEARADDEVMAHFLVAFDRLTTRTVKDRWEWDFNTRTSSKVQELKPRRDIIRRLPKKKERSEWSVGYRRPGDGAFSFVTRRYLQRRAWRYFRKMGRKDPKRYRPAVMVALKLYPEDALANVAQLMDAWGLMNALYHDSKVLSRKPAGAEVAEGQALAALEPAPFLPSRWADCLDDLLGLYLEARSQTVRTWALKVLRRDYTPKLKGLPMSKVRLFLRHPSQEAQLLGAELLRGVEGLDNLALDEWLTLLALDNEAAMPIICELVQKHVSPARLNLGQCVELARSGWGPVADLGFSWAKAKKVNAADLPELLKLADAKVAHVRGAASAWLTQLLLLNEGDGLWQQVRVLLDATRPEPRAAALELMQKDKRFGDHVELWRAMAESPWPEVRAALLAQLPAREKSFAPGTLHQVWAQSLLAVRGGTRARSRATQQVAARVVARPEEAAQLLGLLGFMLRSAMPAERRGALAQLTRAAVASSDLRGLISARLPELDLGKLEVAS